MTLPAASAYGIYEVLPSSEDFRIPSDAKSVQFCRSLSVGQYEGLAKALKARPEVKLRIYDGFGLTRERFTNLDVLRYFVDVRKISVQLWGLQDLDGFSVLNNPDSVFIGWTKKKSLSLRFLWRFDSIRTLSIEGHTRDIDVVAQLRDLRHLKLRSVALPDIEFLIPLPRLQRLEMRLGGTTNLRALAELKALRYLELWRVKGLSDLSSIAAIVNLEFLWLQALSRVEELPSFESLQKLWGVYLETMNGLCNLQSVADAPNLERVYLADMSATTLTAIQAFVRHPTLRYFQAGLGSLRRNAAASASVGLPDPPSWRDVVVD